MHYAGETTAFQVAATATALSTIERELNRFYNLHQCWPEAIRVSPSFGSLLLFELSKKLKVVACFPLFIQDIPVVTNSQIPGMVQLFNLTRQLKEDF